MTGEGRSCGFVDESFRPARALRAVWTRPWTTGTTIPKASHHKPRYTSFRPSDCPTTQTTSVLEYGSCEFRGSSASAE